MVNEVLTPFSYALSQESDIFDISENIVTETEATEDSSVEDLEGDNGSEDTESSADTEDDAQVEESSVEDLEIQEESEDTESSADTEDDDVQAEESSVEDLEGDDGSEKDDGLYEDGEFDGDFTGDYFTGDDFMGEVLTGEVFTGEILTGEVLTGEETSGIVIGVINEGGEEGVKETVTDKAEEIAQIWQSLNKQEMELQEEYSDIIVKVVVPAGSLPSDAEVRINPVKEKKSINTIRDSLVKNAELNKTFELFSFDISFVYTLSNGEEIELQSRKLQPVKISFNYKKNVILRDIDSDEDRELKIYNLERPKDYDDKLIDKVEEVEINKFESSKGEMVVNTQEYSVYAIVMEGEKGQEENSGNDGIEDGGTENVEVTTGGDIVDVDISEHDETNDETGVEPDEVVEGLEEKTCEENYHLIDGECEIDTYTITWRNEDRTIMDTTKVAYGEMPIHNDPVQPADEKYTYTFNGWDKPLEVVTGNAEYRATYTYTLRKYTIIWKNEDGTVMDTTKVAYGEMPTHVDPIQPADVQYAYQFAGWEPEISEVKGNAEYRAKYIYSLRTYTVIWKNDDGAIIEEDRDVPYGTIPIYGGVMLTKQGDGNYEYVFVGWEPEVSEVNGNVEYVAKFDFIEIENEDTEDSSVIVPELQTGDGVDSFLESNNDDNMPSGVDGHESEGSYVSFGGGGNTQDSLSGNLEGEGDVWEGEEEEGESGFWGNLWDTLKSFFLEDEDGYLRGSGTINDITVSIEAEEGTFPSGTEVVIKGVPQKRLESIQTSLIEDENNNVREDAQILAFDISFVYSGEEIQPEKEVSVKFNYEENSDFQGLSLSEVSVYHIDDETDEGEEIEVVNKEGDEIEILATSFSTYAVVAQKGLRNTPVSGRGIMDQMPDFDFTGIVVARPASLSGTHKESPAVYIVMDRNLGATEAGRGLSSYGYLYQFGNNYGFSGEQGTTAVNGREADIDLTQYSNSNPYFSGTFVLGKKPAATGGTTTTPDWATTSNDNIWGGEAIKESYRQGPCPSGWHVPTIGEWNDVVDYWTTTNGGMNVPNFENELKLPLPGSLSRSYGNYYGTSYGNEGYYWSTSSSNESSKPSYVLQITSTSKNSLYPENRANGYSVRCFKDDDTIYTITYNDGINDDEVFADQSGTGMRGDPLPSFVGGDPEWNGDGNRYFIGWYMENNGGYTYVDIVNNQITSDITLYAKWSACAEGECVVPTDTISIVYDMDVYFAVNSGNTSHYTLMDRNLGASAPGTGSNSYGDLFQWGNNYGFSNTGYLPSKTTHTVNASYNGPGNYYYSTTFIYNSNGADWSNPSNYNLWGDTTNTSVARQGPCPDGYHVPSSGEWLSLYNSRYSINGAAICSSIPNCVEKIKNDLLLPAVGRIDEKSKIGLKDAASYWSSSYSNTANKSYGFYLRAADKEKQIQPNNEDYRARARSVRCVKDVENTPMQIDLNGGVLGSVSIYGKKLHYLTDPIKTGAVFAGWYSNSALTTKIEDESSIARSTTTLYAKWNVEGEVEYTFNANGGIFEIEDSGDIIETETFVQTYMQGDPFDLTQIQEPTRECHTFSGWYDAASGGNQIQFPATVTTPITAYAYWTAGNCTITTGVVGSGNITIYPAVGPYAYSSAVTFTAVPGSGYIFDKWILNDEEISSGGSLTLNMTLTGNVNLTGYFLPSEISMHTVTLTGDGYVYILKINGIEREWAVLEYGSDVTIDAVPKPGYHFVRWNKEVGR